MCLFDYSVYEELKQAGITTVYYLPLAVNEKRLAELDGRNKKCSDDISFVGSLYTEPKHRIYDKFQKVDAYTKGYLEGSFRRRNAFTDIIFSRIC